jgi:hypothetical protein
MEKDLWDTRRETRTVEIAVNAATIASATNHAM